jgi:phosphatidylethanolamine-binding protein (PEBP) family uncharacterized protein
MALTLSSPAFADKEFIPAQYTCDGDNVSPPVVVWGTGGHRRVGPAI